MNFDYSIYYNIVNFIIIFASIITIYIFFRNYFYNNKKDINKLQKRLSVMLIIFGCLSVIFFIDLWYLYIDNYLGRSHEVKIPLLGIIFVGEPFYTYIFRILGIVLFLISISGIIFMHIKNKIDKSLIFVLVGIISNIMCYIDVLILENKRLRNSDLIINKIGVVSLMLYIVIYIIIKRINKKKVNN